MKSPHTVYSRLLMVFSTVFLVLPGLSEAAGVAPTPTCSVYAIQGTIRTCIQYSSPSPSASPSSSPSSSPSAKPSPSPSSSSSPLPSGSPSASPSTNPTPSPSPTATTNCLYPYFITSGTPADVYTASATPGQASDVVNFELVNDCATSIVIPANPWQILNPASMPPQGSGGSSCSKWGWQ